MSICVHALLLAAVLSGAALDAPARPRPSSVEPAVNVVLLPGTGTSSPTPSPAAPPRPPRRPQPQAPATAEPPRPPPAALPKAPSSTPTPDEPFAAVPNPGVAAASAAQTAAFDPAAAADYRRRLLDHIANYRRTTAFAGGDRSGVVLVHFSLNRTGRVLGVSIETSSGAAELDDEAMATIWRAQPMPAIPPALPEHVSITLPVSFGTAGRSPG